MEELIALQKIQDTITYISLAIYTSLAITVPVGFLYIAKTYKDLQKKFGKTSNSFPYKWFLFWACMSFFISNICSIVAYTFDWAPTFLTSYSKSFNGISDISVAFILYSLTEISIRTSYTKDIKASKKSETKRRAGLLNAMVLTVVIVPLVFLNPDRVDYTPMIGSSSIPIWIQSLICFFITIYLQGFDNIITDAKISQRLHATGFQVSLIWFSSTVGIISDRCNLFVPRWFKYTVTSIMVLVTLAQIYNIYYCGYQRILYYKKEMNQ